jgi:hypothetical protein
MLPLKWCLAVRAKERKMATDIPVDADPVVNESPDLPIACSLSADELRARGDEVAGLFGHVARVQELPDGYAFAFAGDASRAHDLLDFVVAERACCPFFTFDLTFPSPHELVWLQLRGGAGVKDFVREAALAKVPAGVAQPGQSQAAR